MAFFGSCTDLSHYIDAEPYRLKSGNGYRESNCIKRQNTSSPLHRPPAASFHKMGVAGSFQRRACYRSVDDLTGEHLYEELPAHSAGPPKLSYTNGPPQGNHILGPAKLAPIGGTPVYSNRGKVVLRPIAFKPVLPHRNSARNRQQGSTIASPGGHHVDESYSSDDSKHYSNSSQVSYRSEKSQGYASSEGTKDGFVSGYSSADFKDLKDASCTFSRLSSRIEDYTQTPSPSDSGIVELEAMLKEKDNEIAHLRDTMEQNEQVIFRVYEEKEQQWHAEIDRLRRENDEKLKTQQQKSFKIEQGLLLQIYQLQQERKDLRASLERCENDKETLRTRCSEYELELTALRTHLDETKWNICQKTGEISLLKSQLKETNTDTCSRKTEALSLKCQIRDIRNQLTEKQAETERLQAACDSVNEELYNVKSQLDIMQRDSQQHENESMVERQRADSTMSNLRKEIDHLRIELAQRKNEMESQQNKFEEERIVWAEEKEKVLRYQKQLQLNYVQIYRKNRSLEHEVEQLTLELETRDLKTIEKEYFPGLEEVDESQC